MKLPLPRFAMLVMGCTFLLIFAGGLVTSTGSGLAVPDWPLSYGQVFPRMEGGVLYEHGHRLIASLVGVLTVVLALWTARKESRPWVRTLGWAMLAAVIVQGALGGLTVLLRLPSSVSVAHAGLAQAFFGMTAVMAFVAVPGDGRTGGRADGQTVSSGVRALSLAMVIAIYCQILIGAVVRHIGAGLAIPDFPLSFGRLIPVFVNPLIGWQFAHRVGALVAAVLVLASATLALRAGERTLVAPAAVLVALLGLQVLLGALTIWTRKAVIPTTLHVAVGASLFATALVLSVRTHNRADAQTRG